MGLRYVNRNRRLFHISRVIIGLFGLVSGEEELLFINCCISIRLLRECRCSLDVSFSSYKSLLMYGEILAFIGLIQYYFVVNMSQAMWVLIDGTTGFFTLIYFFIF